MFDLIPRGSIWQVSTSSDSAVGRCSTAKQTCAYALLNRKIEMHILITGAAGHIGTRLRKLLKGVYPHIRLSDLRSPKDLRLDEEFISADLADYEKVKTITEGIDGIVHLGGHARRGSWDTIHKSNIVGCYNLFEAAYRSGVKRVVFASSNHAVGFYPRERK